MRVSQNNIILGILILSPDNTDNVAIELLTVPPKVMTVHLKEYGFIKVFWIVFKDGNTQY